MPLSKAVKPVEFIDITPVSFFSSFSYVFGVCWDMPYSRGWRRGPNQPTTLRLLGFVGSCFGEVGGNNHCAVYCSVATFCWWGWCGITAIS